MTFTFKSTLPLALGTAVLTSHLTFVDMGTSTTTTTTDYCHSSPADMDGLSEAVMVVCNQVDDTLKMLCTNASVIILYQPEVRPMLVVFPKQSKWKNLDRAIGFYVEILFGDILQVKRAAKFLY